MAQITLNSSGVASSGALVLQSNGTTTAVTINASQGVEFIAGTAALPAITTTGDTNTGIFFPAADTIAFSEGGAEAMRIDSAGNLLVSTTGVPNGTSIYGSGFAPISFGRSRLSMASSSTSSLQLVNFFNPNGEVGSISTSGSATAYTTSSDYRLKNTIVAMTGALAKVALLKPVTYKWNADGSGGQGFIAHELQEVVPDCVTGTKDDVETYTDDDGNEQTRPKYQGIDVSFLVATLTAAIQEQQAIIESLTQRINALEGQ